MAILGVDTGDDDIVGGGTSDEPGQTEKNVPRGTTESAREKDRESASPEGKKDLQDSDSPSPVSGTRVGKSSFGQYQGIPVKKKIVIPCLNCSHGLADHGMYEKRLCLFDEECGCIGLKIDNKIIPSRMK